ncbi:hypothetical protein CK203_064824 [Vitis vinifera]|uniref:Reverse transcriptase domain-containing protein n=1 Tax=Vitis vinifera TaxID=29760 RepID=A0A438G740_VITVI|nr:hypothetical protein CK203_064824 [Vitis vinifera]
MLEGFRVGRNRTRASICNFDDTIFFSNTREEELQTLKSLLLVFGHISGLKVNLDKSSIYGINLDQAHLSRLAEMLDCKASGWPILYLGLPLGGNPKACGFWDPVIERISSRLDGWQKPTYPSGEDNSYPILPYPFAMDWGRQKRSFSEVDVVCKPKAIGGLGFGNISWRNLALLGKWLWRYPREGSALWHQAIAQVFQEFSLFTRYVVGNGERIRFWEDLWWGDQPLGTQYPRLFRVVMDKNISISSVLGPTHPFSWNLNFRRNLSDSKIEDLEGLMRSLDELHLSPSDFPSKFVGILNSFQSEVLCLVSGTQEAWGISRSSFSSLFLDDWVVAQGIVLWQAASITLIQVVWWERNRGFSRIKQGIQSSFGTLLFSLFLWAFCSKAFKGTPLM